MNFKRFLHWPIIAIVLLSSFLGVISLPDKYQPEFFPNTIKEMKVNLGLDLQGGSQLDYSIDLREVAAADKEQIVEGVMDVINSRVNRLGVSEPNIYTSQVGSETHIIVELAGVKDLEQAKNTVGKTIQLEFKQENFEVNPNIKETVRTDATKILEEIKTNPENFTLIAERERLANPERVEYQETELLFRDEVAGANIQNKVFAEGVAAGTFVPELIEDTAGMIMTASNQIKQKEGLFLVKVLEKNDAVERTITQEKEVQTSHILIQYKGSERAAELVTRSKEEAKTLATEVLAKARAEGANFAELAKQYTDEEAGKTSGGKLTTAVKAGGSYVEEFTNAAMKLEKDGEITPTITETSFGYHIIRADKVTPASETKKTEPQVKIAKLYFSTMPEEWKATELNGQFFERADVTFDQFSYPQVSIVFNAEGAKLFEKITEETQGKRLAIFVGGELISAPQVNEKITGGQAVINGNFTVEEAKNLAKSLNTGAIPAPINLVGQYSIGATLGQEALNSSLVAGAIGVGLLVLYMFAYYRVPGLVASIALGVYSIILIFLIQAKLPLGLALLIALAGFAFISNRILQNEKEPFWEKTISLVVACFGLFFFTFLLSSPVVMTLAGIAGVILSIGMAVDANVLIFERIKEEIRDGRPYLSAVQAGFDRAWSSIRDSNFSSLITCAILYYFGTSIIKGFALNLAAGILISMFTAITVTKVLMVAMKNRKVVENKKLMGFFTKSTERAPFKIMEKSKIWLGVSSTLVTISIISLFTFGLNTGIDFKGGTLMDINFTPESKVTTERIKETLQTYEDQLQVEQKKEDIWGSPTVVSSGENSYIIRLGYINADQHDLVLAKLKDNLDPKLQETRFTTIGPTISENLKNKAVLSLIITLVAIIFYIAFAFRHIPKELNSWKFGASAIVALVHDVIITLGIFSIFQLEVDALFITALLTVIGFSVHDTIVVFDRIRENLKGFDRTKQTFNQVCNTALTQTMARSINTSISTLITLAALLIWGAESIFLFSLALVIGITIGTYSSIFIATPILANMINRSKQK
jgi:SecD/SecF fusion protein